jgi:hypothetical protein
MPEKNHFKKEWSSWVNEVGDKIKEWDHRAVQSKGETWALVVPQKPLLIAPSEIYAAASHLLESPTSKSIKTMR